MMKMARRWQNRTARQIVNYPANGFEARDAHQIHTPSKESIIPKKALYFILLVTVFFGLHGCGGILFSTLSSGKNVYDAYSLSVDRRDFYTLGQDALIIANIKGFLATEELFDSLSVGVESFYGHVYLIGEFENRKELRRAVNYAKNTNGVRKVTAYVKLSSQRDKCTLADDLMIIGKVKSVLFADKGVIGSNVHVHVVQCKAVLLGIVANDYRKERAQNIVKKMGYKVISFIRALN